MRALRRVFVTLSAIVLAPTAFNVAAPGPAARARDTIVASVTKRIGAPAEASAVQAFDADRPPTVRLAVAGDVGTGGGSEYKTAAAVARAERDRSFDALVLLGDNVYPSGDPARLDATVFRPFRAVLDGGTQLVPVLGNHDVAEGRGPGQLAAFGLSSSWYARHLGGVLLIGLDSNRAADPVQRAWLERTLADATERWKIVALHFPPYSAGWHGSSQSTRDAFSPLFERYGVQVVLSGHDHDYQRTKAISGVTYVVSGGAAKLRPTGRADFTASAWSTYHFVDIAVWADRLQLRAINQDGQAFDTTTISP